MKRWFENRIKQATCIELLVVSLTVHWFLFYLGQLIGFLLLCWAYQ